MYDDGGSSMFGRAYFTLCQLHAVPILTDLLSPALESDHHLYLDVDKIKRDDEWSPILKAMKITRDLAQIYIYSNGIPNEARNPLQLEEKRVDTQVQAGNRFSSAKSSVANIYRILPHLMGSVKESLTGNLNLSRLEICGIVLRDTALVLLAKGLFENEQITDLSLARTELGDKGLITLSPSLRTIVHLKNLNLAACRITLHGAHVISSLLKSLSVRRQADKWAWSLRGQDLESEESEKIVSKTAPRPLERLNLCLNPIGDDGFEPLADLIREEVGLLALDLQMTGLTNKSGLLALETFKNNQEILVLDMRNNKIEGKILFDLLDHLAVNDKKRGHKPLVWLDGVNPVKNTYHMLIPSIRSKMHTNSSIKKKRETKEIVNSHQVRIPVAKFKKDKTSGTRLIHDKNGKNDKPQKVKAIQPIKSPVKPQAKQVKKTKISKKILPALTKSTKSEPEQAEDPLKQLQTIESEKMLSKENKELKQRVETLEGFVRGILTSSQTPTSALATRNATRNPTPKPKEDDRDEHLDMLIKLMEASLSNFHAMLDHIDK